MYIKKLFTEYRILKNLNLELDVAKTEIRKACDLYEQEIKRIKNYLISCLNKDYNDLSSKDLYDMLSFAYYSYHNRSYTQFCAIDETGINDKFDINCGRHFLTEKGFSVEKRFDRSFNKEVSFYCNLEVVAKTTVRSVGIFDKKERELCIRTVLNMFELFVNNYKFSCKTRKIISSSDIWNDIMDKEEHYENNLNNICIDKLTIQNKNFLNSYKSEKAFNL